MCAIGRSPSDANRMPRWINSSGYFFGLATSREHPFLPGHHPGFKVSVEPGTALAPGSSPPGDQSSVFRFELRARTVGVALGVEEVRVDLERDRRFGMPELA